MSRFRTPGRQRIARKPLSQAQSYQWMRQDHFPIHFFIRNLAYLEREAWFARKSPASRARWATVLFKERAQCLRDVRRLIAPHQGEASWKRERPRMSGDVHGAESSYCDHCGGCCEIASGLPEFPGESQLPRSWRVCFGEGLGVGHRFCAFMWEGDRSGTSLCAIHPWRAGPCRVFEADDCELFKQDIDFIAFSKSRRLKDLLRLLPRILRRHTARRHT